MVYIINITIIKNLCHIVELGPNFKFQTCLLTGNYFRAGKKNKKHSHLNTVETERSGSIYHAITTAASIFQYLNLNSFVACPKWKKMNIIAYAMKHTGTKYCTKQTSKKVIFLIFLPQVFESIFSVNCKLGNIVKPNSPFACKVLLGR